MSIFHIINFKKKIPGHRVLDFFNKKLILDYYFCLKSVPVFLFQIFIENLNLLFINLLLMIQLYIPWEGEGAMMKI
jgi:hypothetical protein